MGSIETGQYINTHTFQSPISQIWIVWCFEANFWRPSCMLWHPVPLEYKSSSQDPRGGGRGDVSWWPTNLSRLLMPAAVTSLISGFSSRLWGYSPLWYQGAPLPLGGYLGILLHTQNFYLLDFPHSHSTRFCETGENCWLRNVLSARYFQLRTVLPPSIKAMRGCQKTISLWNASAGSAWE